jgi:putative acetyltransferase
MTSVLTRRPLEAPDVTAILEIIRECRREYGLEGRVLSILEPSDYAMFELYRQHRSSYFVAIADGDVAGGGGIAPLADGHQVTCELQRMYLRPANRGHGIGQLLLASCIQAAHRFNFERCYAETISEMTTAVAFYQRHGFRLLTAPLGRTGHGHNDRWMMLDIRALLPTPNSPRI